MKKMCAPPCSVDPQDPPFKVGSVLMLSDGCQTVSALVIDKKAEREMLIWYRVFVRDKTLIVYVSGPSKIKNFSVRPKANQEWELLDYKV